MVEFVASKIDSVYKELTRSDRYMMGGSASLVLVNKDDPFSGTCRTVCCASMWGFPQIACVCACGPVIPPVCVSPAHLHHLRYL
jgi:hypothetical protein